MAIQAFNWKTIVAYQYNKTGIYQMGANEHEKKTSLGFNTTLLFIARAVVSINLLSKSH